MKVRYMRFAFLAPILVCQRTHTTLTMRIPFFPFGVQRDATDFKAAYVLIHYRQFMHPCKASAPRYTDSTN
jgi:hypothetical protein